MELKYIIRDFNCVIKVYLVQGYYGQIEHITTVNYK